MYNKLILILFIALLSTALMAEPDLYPITSIAENMTSNWCVNYTHPLDGLNVLHSLYHPGEFISANYYTQSGPLDNIYSDDRFDYYDVALYPTVIFNGTNSVTGGGPNIQDGSTYHNMLKPKLFAGSPVKMQITGFNSSTGSVSARVTMISPDFSLNAQSVRFILVENDVNPPDTKVVRQVITQPITLSGANNHLDFNASFNILPEFNTANLWVAAFVQMNNKTIIQVASNLSQPQYQVRVVLSFAQQIVGPVNDSYLSDDIWFYNIGGAQTITIQLIQDDGPSDWYFNYCDDLYCYPGSVPTNFTLGAGETKKLHLNMYIGSSGTSNFHYLITSPNMQPITLPFSYQTEDTSVNDLTLPISGVRLLGNYPNPFNAQTLIRLETNKSISTQDIDVFNTKGQLVSSVRTSELKAGINEVLWNAIDKNGNQLTNGIYFYRIRGMEGNKTNKLLIINN